jgi:hypothetical protein
MRRTAARRRACSDARMVAATRMTAGTTLPGMRGNRGPPDPDRRRLPSWGPRQVISGRTESVAESC